MKDLLALIDVPAMILLLVQLPASLQFIGRLIKFPQKHPSIQKHSFTHDMDGSVSIVIPTLNEALRIGPLLKGLRSQGGEVREIIVVDSKSHDGTIELVEAAQQDDPRFRLIDDKSLPENWVGRPWALHTGYLHSSKDSEWILGMDADTEPEPDLVASLVKTTENLGYDMVSVSPKFILRHPGEFLLQPALLMTLIYRFFPNNSSNDHPERILANGQCFLCRRKVLSSIQGYNEARSSFCDDVTLARHIASQGYKVGFLDGAEFLKVRMYEGALETWKEWGRSLDLKDASSTSRLLKDLYLLTVLQGVPIIVILSSFFIALNSFLVGLNILLIMIRIMMLFAISPSYDLKVGSGAFLFWLSPIADPIAVIRIFLSSIKSPTEWRGRKYNNKLPAMEVSPYKGIFRKDYP